LERKAPVMEELNGRLKKIRLQKIKDCKEQLKRKVVVRHLTGTGVTVIEEEL
jgi:hypothetical protein